ncbi:MAG: helix-turn-helix domain-containing protein [Desulfovibrio sp.]|uniref:helix-turn-helix domain-containing protein n=1 Tax=Desulfovibrio sp. 7SRBS1 TaxID=3378064 RepID=UPI003B3DAEB8
MSARFGEIVGKARRNKGLTLKKLSQFVGIGPSILSEIEHGRRLPPKDTNKLKDLAIILGLDQTKMLDSAKIERQATKPKLFDRLYAINPEAALGLCRAQDEPTDEDFLNALIKALELLGKEGN